MATDNEIKRPQGRPRRIWTDEERTLFEKLCGIMCTRNEVASILGMDPRTLVANIADTYPETPTWDEAFERFSSNGRASLRRKQFETAMDGSIPMLIFLGKNYLGQADKPTEEKNGKAQVQPEGRLTVLTNSSRFAGKMAANG